MSFFVGRVPKYDPPKTLEFNWGNFRGGLNTLFRESEIANNELAQSQNIMLLGQGVPTKRWGTAVYYLAGESGGVRGLKGFYQKDGTNQLLSLTDDGYLTQRSSASYTQIAGVSWASGYNAEIIQLNNMMYIVNGQRELARYSNPTLVGFSTIAQPSAVFATQISGVSGTNTMSFRLTHVSTVGETAPTDAFILANQPIDLTKGAVKVSWTNASTASGIRTGTNIYGRVLGDETFLAAIDAQATQWIDDGNSIPQLFSYPPLADSTGGPIAKYVARFKDRLIYAGVSGDPTMLLISGRVPNHERFDFGHGGGFVRIEPDSGDDITGITALTDKIIVFKERSVWQIKINSVQIGNFYLIEPVYDLITSSIGCASHRSIAYVENDILFLGTNGRGVFILGYEPGIFADFLRTNELSVKVRPYFLNLTPTQAQNACAVYHDKKYFISFPGKSETMVFDRERTGWIGPWTIDARGWEVYYDSNDNAHLLIEEDDTANVTEVSSSYPGDKGTAISTILRTKREDFKDWTVFKTIKNIFTKWRNVLGSVSADIRLEQRTGNTITSESFTVTPGSGNSGWGADGWGVALWADSEETGEAKDISEIVKQSFLQKPARNVQLMVKTNNLNDNYELLGVKGEGQAIGIGYRPSSWKT